MDGLGQTARGVLGSVLVLAVAYVAGKWLLESPDPPVLREPRPPSRMVSVATPATDGLIRVVLTRRPAQSVRLRVEGAFRVVPLSGGAAVAFAKPLSERTVSVRSGKITLHDRTFPGDGIELVPDESPAIWIDGRKYRGSVRLHAAAGRLWPVNVLPLEEYVAAVVDAEMPAAFPPAAREAQAVAARTYAVSCRRDPPHLWFDLFSTPISQNYLGTVYRGSDGRLLAGETPSGRAAAAATAGLVCTCDGRLFRTYYSACCGGRTLSGATVFADDTPALRSVECGGCSDAPLFRWQRSAADLAAFNRLVRIARTRSPSFGSIQSAETTARSQAPGTVALSDGRRTVRLPATEVKSALGLPSLLYDLTGNEDRLVARGRGHGHGVGLCQWGAKGLAERGLSAEQILEHYYPGSELTGLP